ncbi:MAG: shikimate dehydrogenase [Chloroflexi bacterium RBG_16_58_8]|nr:MAG: shikimate dehydrogenase [Chloroflexi bacterium RBG_16_58_8]
MTDKEISGKTQICALIGDPVEHSMSPAMHNAAYQALGLDYVYIPFRVKARELEQAVRGLRALNVRGFNVTMPHKVTIIPLLNSLDPLAEKIGAVNTVVNDGGDLKGYNTDGEGFLRALREKGMEPDEKNIVLLGAGGASRAISYVLAQQGARLAILNRRLELAWAEDIARLILEDLDIEVEVMELGAGQLAGALEDADILVNATSVGMSPESSKSPVPAALLKPGLTVFDIVYNPIETRLLREAKAAGARVISGVDMLAWQGALAFEKWTGQAAPLGLMRREALKLLEAHED